MQQHRDVRTPQPTAKRSSVKSSARVSTAERQRVAKRTEKRTEKRSVRQADCRIGASVAEPIEQQVDQQVEQQAEQTAGKESRLSVAKRLAETKRKMRSLRAGKNFARQFGGGSAGSADEVGPRAALYKGEMGASQRRANRMQDTSSPAEKKSRGFAHGFSVRGVIDSFKSSPRFIMASTVVACLLAVGFFLYPAAQQWYLSERHYQQVQAEYTAVLARNHALESDIAYLQTNEGIEQRAREQFGWVKSNEHAVRITNLGDVQSAGWSSTPYAQVLPGSVEAPTTWYSPVLDVIFGVSGSSE